jgi:hypothetical protein
VRPRKLAKRLNRRHGKDGTQCERHVRVLGAALPLRIVPSSPAAVSRQGGPYGPSPNLLQQHEEDAWLDLVQLRRGHGGALLDHEERKEEREEAHELHG